MTSYCVIIKCRNDSAASERVMASYEDWEDAYNRFKEIERELEQDNDNLEEYVYIREIEENV